jgi:DNA (cytosine-5)-methyltransferase 3A
MNILSLFDGVSAAQCAFIRAGIKYDTYFASEVKPHAISVTQAMYPKTIQLGDVTKIDWSSLPAIDFLIFGSPCTNLSISGNRLGLLGEQSKLFYKAIEALNYLKPTWFLMENVSSMSDEDKETISGNIGVDPIEINSNCFSAQSRSRYYWCNWKVKQPRPSITTLDDIIDIDADEKDYYYRTRLYSTTSNRKGLIRVGDIGTKGDAFRVYSSKGKSRTLKALAGGSGGKTGLYKFDNIVRQLSPLECCRLQTYDTRCFTEISLSKDKWQELFGDSFTVDVIVHILKNNLFLV